MCERESERERVRESEREAAAKPEAGVAGPLQAIEISMIHLWRDKWTALSGPLSDSGFWNRFRARREHLQ